MGRGNEIAFVFRWGNVDAKIEAFVEVAVEAWKKGVVSRGEAVDIETAYASGECVEHYGVELKIISQIGPGQVVCCCVICRFYILDNQAAMVVL